MHYALILTLKEARRNVIQKIIRKRKFICSPAGLFVENKPWRPARRQGKGSGSSGPGPGTAQSPSVVAPARQQQPQGWPVGRAISLAQPHLPEGLPPAHGQRPLTSQRPRGEICTWPAEAQGPWPPQATLEPSVRTEEGLTSCRPAPCLLGIVLLLQSSLLPAHTSSPPTG